MELTDGLLGDTPMLVAAGAMDEDSSDLLRTALAKLSAARHNIVFLDLTDVDDIGAHGLSVLIDWVEALRGRGWLGLIAPNAASRRALEAGDLLSHPNVRLFATRQAGRVVTQERQST